MKILIAVDDSAESLDALHTAFTLFGSDPHYIVASVGMNPVYLPASPMGIQPDLVLLAEQRDYAEGEAEATALAASEELPVGTDIRAAVGSPGPALAAMADRESADLIVIGSHDRSILDRLLHASVGHYLVDHASCPVLVVRGDRRPHLDA